MLNLQNFMKKDELAGGHVIMLGADPASQAAALEAIRAYPGGLQVGGGVKLENATSYLNEGASHVIVTSFVFRVGKLIIERLKKPVDLVGKQRLVLDLSCRKKDYRITIRSANEYGFPSAGDDGGGSHGSGGSSGGSGGSGGGGNDDDGGSFSPRVRGGFGGSRRSLFGRDRCYKCGKQGHMADDCPNAELPRVR